MPPSVCPPACVLRWAVKPNCIHHSKSMESSNIRWPEFPSSNTSHPGLQVINQARTGGASPTVLGARLPRRARACMCCGWEKPPASTTRGRRKERGRLISLIMDGVRGVYMIQMPGSYFGEENITLWSSPRQRSKRKRTTW